MCSRRFTCFGIALLLSWMVACNVRAQQTLSLEQCLQLAVQNNIQVQVAENSVASTQLTYVQKKFDFLPTVAMSLPVNKSFGNSADIFTQQIAVSPWTSNPSLSASIVAFRGLSKWNDLRSAKYNLAASQYSLDDLKNDIRLNTALAFFQVMFAQENLEIGRNRLQLLEKQLDNIQKQFEAGSKTQGDVFGIQSQLAAERVNAVTQQNIYDRALLDLVLLLNLDAAQNYALQRPTFVDVESEPLPDLETIFQAARLADPGVRQQEFKALAARYAINSSRAAYFPTLNINFGLASFYSSNAKTRIGYTLVDGIPQVLYGPRIPMFEQFQTNFSQTMSLSLNVPIFSRLMTRQNFLISKLNAQTAQLNIKAEEIQLYKSIQTAYLDAKAADAKYAATQQQMESLKESLRYAQARYDAGMLDFLSYLEVLNNHTRASIEQVQSQYDRILKRKILDVYQGKTLNF